MDRVLWLLRRLGTAGLLLLLLAGCNPNTLRNQVQQLLVRPSTAEGLTQQQTSAPLDSRNRILVQGADGNLYIVSKDGKERFALTTDASLRRAYSQPTWSPDAMSVAWSALGRSGSELVISRFDGTDRVAREVPFLPFYIAWSPTGDQLAYLSNWQVVDEPSMALRLVNPAAGEDAVKTIAAGAPFYFAWAPDASRLLAHIENERVEVYELGGAVQSLAISGGDFSAPQWSSSGEQLIYAVADESTQRLLLTDAAGQPLETLTDFAGRVTFALSGDGQQVAYVATEPNVAAGTLGALYVVDTETRRTREITNLPTLAFYWSPDSQKLAYLTLDRVGNRLGMRWSVWDGQRSRQYARFLPSNELQRNYLPFFDQYAQSHRIWSPASDAFVFAGTLANGESGVWVQMLSEENMPPANIGPGVSATWSPQ